MTNKSCEVLIIGAGPAGLTAAYFLAKAGRSVCVLEQKKEIGVPVCCGEAISAKSLDNSGLYDDSYIDSKVKGFRIFFPNNKFFFVESPGYLINRDKFEQFLAQQTKNHGAEIILSTKATRLDADCGFTRVETSSGTIEPGLVIGADGPESIVEKAFFTNIFHSLDAMQYKIKKNSSPHGCGGFLDFYYDMLSPYYFWVFEKQNEFNIGGIAMDRKILQEFIKKRFPLAGIERASFSRGKIPMQWIKKCIYKNKTFLVGDAAGLTNPVTFAGIYSALASGKACAEAIINSHYSRRAGALASYPARVRKAVYSGNEIRKIAAHSYKFPEKIKNFIGDYFEGRNFRTKDYLRFLQMALKTPGIVFNLLPLLSHRELLKNHANDIW
jgi:digeranylgeranylglycerophospholipid reductase